MRKVNTTSSSHAVDTAATNRVTVAPSLDENGRLAEWPPQSKPFAPRDYDAPRPGWLLLQNALGNLPYSGGLGRALSPGQSVDEAFAALSRYVERLAETLRYQVEASQRAEAELAQHRRILAAELDREDMLAAMRKGRGAIDRTVNKR